MIEDAIHTMRTAEVKGDYHSDRGLWDACHQIAVNADLTMEVRLEALRRMNDLVGEDLPVNEEALADYIRESS